MKKILFYIVVSLMFLSVAFAQSKKNIELILGQVDKSISELNLSDKFAYKLNFSSNGNYDVVKGRILYNLNKFANGNNEKELFYHLDEVKVVYPEMFRDGFFGDFLVSREIFYSFRYSISENGSLIHADSASYSFSDTVQVNEIPKIETQPLEFTKSELPSEPFWDSLVEPIVAVGAALVSIVLFFTVRSE